MVRKVERQNGGQRSVTITKMEQNYNSNYIAFKLKYNTQIKKKEFLINSANSCCTATDLIMTDTRYSMPIFN